jgi:hypothetical protein
MLNQSSEVLLVKWNAGERLHDLLEKKEGEGIGEEFEDDWPIPQLPTHTPETGGQNAPVVQVHRSPHLRGVLVGSTPHLPLGFLHQAHFEEEFIPFEHSVAVPTSTLESECNACPISPLLSHGPLWSTRDPLPHLRFDDFRQDRRSARTQILPREI